MLHKIEQNPLLERDRYIQSLREIMIEDEFAFNAFDEELWLKELLRKNKKIKWHLNTLWRIIFSTAILINLSKTFLVSTILDMKISPSLSGGHSGLQKHNGKGHRCRRPGNET